MYSSWYRSLCTFTLPTFCNRSSTSLFTVVCPTGGGRRMVEYGGRKTRYLSVTNTVLLQLRLTLSLTFFLRLTCCRNVNFATRISQELATRVSRVLWYREFGVQSVNTC